MYADDHQIYHAGADEAAVTSQLKDSANLATTSYDSNLLAGNLKKYQVLNLGFTQNDSNIRSNINYVVREDLDNELLEILSIEILKPNPLYKNSGKRYPVTNLVFVLYILL